VEGIMKEMPIIELRVREFGEQLHAMVMVHHEEIEQFIKAGVDKAIENIGQQIIQEALDAATIQIRTEVKNYLTYGPGGQAIREAMTHALEPLVEMLRKA